MNPSMNRRTLVKSLAVASLATGALSPANALAQTLTPSPTAGATPSPTATQLPSSTPTSAATATATRTPAASPTPGATASATAASTATAQPTLSPSPTSTPNAVSSSGLSSIAQAGGTVAVRTDGSVAMTPAVNRGVMLQAQPGQIVSIFEVQD